MVVIIFLYTDVFVLLANICLIASRVVDVLLTHIAAEKSSQKQKVQLKNDIIMMM